jgi:hypothetical protein
MRRSTLGAAVLSVAVLIPSLAFGHAERPTESPARPGTVPNQNRVHTKVIDVCKTGECAFEHIQSAINSIPANNTAPTLVRIWPGFYKEEPSRVVPHGEPDNDNGTFSYEYMLTHPNAENLVAVVGKKNVTLRGMGAEPRDVVVDAEFKKHVVIRGDRSDGIIIENLSTWHGFDHGVYILDTDGFVIDKVVSGYSREYPFLTFANDHGLLQNCEAFGGGDGGIYPGSSADTGQRSPEELLMTPPDGMGRVSTEIRKCKSYHNVLGYSGTQGDHVWFHDNELYDNAVGFVTDSETDHPNYPQNNLLFENNKVYNNNFNVYATDSDVKATVFANSILIPVGVGVLIASGNDNLVQKNVVYGHDNYGVWLLNGPGVVLGPTGDPAAPPFLSERNTFKDNTMFNPASPAGSENGADFGWDGFGFTNCWTNNLHAPGDTAATSNAVMLPDCTGLPITPGVPNENAIDQVGLVFIDTDGDGANDRPICDLTGTCPAQYDEGPPLENARNFPEGYKPPPTPPTCGPSTCPGSSAASVRGTKTTRPSTTTGANDLPATGVGTPAGLAVALMIGAGAIGAIAIGTRFRSRRPQ